MAARIAVSAGHFSDSDGANFDGFFEHSEAVKWRDLILARLGDKGVKVQNGRLGDKIAHINSFRPACAVEIHFNADARRLGKGSETLYAPGSKNGEELAKAVQSAISSVCSPNRGIKEGWYRMEVGGTVDAFLRKTICPAIIVEPFFIHERSRIEASRETVCDLIAEALLGWVNES